MRDVAVAGAVSEVNPSVKAGSLNDGQRNLLDTFRGLAAQCVLMQHAATDFLPNSWLDHGRLGDIGVSVFFVLSGFLITGNILDRIEARRFTFSEFFISRFARIYCTYLPAIIFVALLDSVSSQSIRYVFQSNYNAPTAIANLTMLQSFPLLLGTQAIFHHAGSLLFGTFGSATPFWTICIEWWLYMTAGLIAVLACGRSSRMVFVALAFAAITPLYFITIGFGNCLTLTWILGGVAATLQRSEWGMRVLRPTSVTGLRRIQAVAASAGVLLALRLVATHGVFYEPIVVTLLATLMFTTLFATRRTGLASAVLRHLSFHSYSLYLTHATVLTLVFCTLPGLDGWQAIGLGVLAGNAIAVPFALVFETPHKALRRFLIRQWDTLPFRRTALG